MQKQYQSKLAQSKSTSALKSMTKKQQEEYVLFQSRSNVI